MNQNDEIDIEGEIATKEKRTRLFEEIGGARHNRWV